MEAILDGEVRRYRLAEIEPSNLEDAVLVRAAPNVIGARIH